MLLGLILHPSLALDTLLLQDGVGESMLSSAPSPSSSVIHGDRQPALITAVAELTTIRHLAVHGHCGHNACSLIKTMRSPLKTASLDFAPLDRGLRIDVLLRRNPGLALAKRNVTLR